MDQSKIRVRPGQTWVWVGAISAGIYISSFKVEKVYTAKDGKRKADSTELPGIVLIDDDCSGAWGHLYNLKVEVGQVWTAPSGNDYTIASIDTVNEQAAIVGGGSLKLTKEGCLDGTWHPDWTLKDTISQPTSHVASVSVEGMNCDRCNSYNTFVEANRPDGKYRCYSCRH